MIDLAALPPLPPDFGWQRLYPGAPMDQAVAVLGNCQVAIVSERVTDGYVCLVGRHRDQRVSPSRTFSRLDRACAWIETWIRLREAAIRQEVAAKDAAFQARHFANWDGGRSTGANGPAPNPAPVSWTASDEHARRHGRKRGRPGPKL